MTAKPRAVSQEIDARIAAAPAAAQAVLRAIRKLALASSPDAEERIGYGMPAVFVNGRVLVYYDAFKGHVGIYPPPRGDAAFMKAVAPYAGPKGNLSLPYGAKTPRALLKAILKARLAEVGPAQATAKKANEPSTVRKAATRRPRWPMPAFVKRALGEKGLMEAYRERPPYQRNDYVGWIARAKTPATQAKRLAQMLDELARGGVYMRMKHPASARTSPVTRKSSAARATGIR